MLAIFILACIAWVVHLFGEGPSLFLGTILCISAFYICATWLFITILVIVCIIALIGLISYV